MGEGSAGVGARCGWPLAPMPQRPLAAMRWARLADSPEIFQGKQSFQGVNARFAASSSIADVPVVERDESESRGEHPQQENNWQNVGATQEKKSPMRDHNIYSSPNFGIGIFAAKLQEEAWKS